MKSRVQHPSVKQRKDRLGWPWFFRYWAEEVSPDGKLKTIRKYHEIAPSKGERAITKKQAEIERDKVLAKVNAPTIDEAVRQVAATGIALFGEVAQMYIDGYLGRENQIAKPTRDKELLYLEKYVIPRWGTLRLNQIQPKAVEDWLHATFDSWWTMHGVRAIMSRVFYHAEGHGLWEEGRRSPASKAKLGKKHHKYERRILSFEQTALFHYQTHQRQPGFAKQVADAVLQHADNVGHRQDHLDGGVLFGTEPAKLLHCSLLVDLVSFVHSDSPFFLAENYLKAITPSGLRVATFYALTGILDSRQLHAGIKVSFLPECS